MCVQVGEKRRAAAVAAAAPAAEPDARVPTGAQSQASGRPSLSDVREDDAAAAREPALAAGGDDEVPVLFAHPGDGSAAQEEAAAAASTVQAAVRERLSAAEAAAAAADEGGDSQAAVRAQTLCARLPEDARDARQSRGCGVKKDCSVRPAREIAAHCAAVAHGRVGRW